MKLIHFPFLILPFLAAGAPPPPHPLTAVADTLRFNDTLYVIRYPRPRLPLVTAADSTQERFRIANARRLHYEAFHVPAKLPTTLPLSLAAEVSTLPVWQPKSSPEVAKLRQQQLQVMIDEALTTKGKRRAKDTSRDIKKLNRAAARD